MKIEDETLRKLRAESMLAGLPLSAQERFRTLFEEAANYADAQNGDDDEFRELMQMVSSLFFVVGFEEGAKQFAATEVLH